MAIDIPPSDSPLRAIVTLDPKTVRLAVRIIHEGDAPPDGEQVLATLRPGQTAEDLASLAGEAAQKMLGSMIDRGGGGGGKDGSGAGTPPIP